MDHHRVHNLRNDRLSAMAESMVLETREILPFSLESITLLTIMDEYFRVKKITAIQNPNQVMWRALHQDYSENFAFDETPPPEKRSGEIVVERLLNGNKGHYGVLEHPQIIFNCGWFPHSTMQQISRHRLLSFDVQSFRYSGKRIVHVANGDRDVEEVFYLRPPGFYTDRSGGRYEYTIAQREDDIAYVLNAAQRYKAKIESGIVEEHARGEIPFDTRQHWVMSGNLRSFMHLLDLRWKADAQKECQQLCDLIFPHIEEWVPEVAAWYLKNRSKRALLAP